MKTEFRGFFVTGTDTDVGKTVACACLVKATGALYWKPVQSGTDDLPGGDTATVANLTGHHPDDFPAPVFSFKAALSPDQAARLEGKTIEPAQLENRLPSKRPLIVEGAGGLMVPLTDQVMMIDIIKRLGLPVIIIARTGLGTINHTLLSLEALKVRHIPVAGVLFCGPDNPDNINTIKRLGQVPVIGHIPVLSPLGRTSIRHAAETLDLSAWM
ncbi:dethiobiotin synthase [Haematospirillum jordaniae]|uniref:ATP-dependent dethiobiotin synthetase BioD n=1 Tax=Haematospirillum jordaniae TaxID=1549855 RepID=A0A143DFG1_9PROT|nr:dethiobiotin synthase [Haematospirillum jordaniae]AMW35396.1 dethiobiotin synthetase [Haematospirillum jordaniae]NKD45530.1 dethiobiotin synthase [Haematospirillum jordaniae]NKD56174.1 dethiobiotin synthase [Haematospirillum jordaniae]NKD58232.1 dethiobiotin synthase [Haematospirillum jordaniae]NKD66597.1 dethiobiotin synthase [Haematospirillum jordaniae]